MIISYYQKYKQNVHKFILCPHIKTKQNVKEGIPCLIGYE